MQALRFKGLPKRFPIRLPYTREPNANPAMSWVAMGESYNLPEPMDGFEAERVISEWIDFYNTERHLFA